jgi:hypothetical protein
MAKLSVECWVNYDSYQAEAHSLTDSIKYVTRVVTLIAVKPVNCVI